jgi:hypothetical protein
MASPQSHERGGLDGDEAGTRVPPPSAAWTPEGRRWALVMLSAVGAVALRAALQPVFGDRLPFIVAFPATAFAAVLWGVEGGLLVAAVVRAGGGRAGDTAARAVRGAAGVDGRVLLRVDPH